MSGHLHACGGRCKELTFDFVTAALSIADIAADVAVAIEFYNSERMAFFWLSVIIFAVAQASYGFLFVATFGEHLSNGSKVCAFLVALPFSQLVPVFTLVESFHLPRVNQLLQSAGLKPTSTAEAPTQETDSLWTLLQRKYHAHAGFLVEALVEAIPQCSLQVAAVIVAQDATALNVFSILLSLAVIGSKGWLAAYSLHRPTFVFNSLTIAADVAGLFATASWLATWVIDEQVEILPVDLSSHLVNSTGVAGACVTLSKVWVYLVSLGVLLGAVGGGGVVLFSMVDDHLKTHDPNPDTGIAVDSVVFNIYIMRGSAWLLSLLPCVTLLVLLRLSLLPFLVFHSLSSEHATHHTFFVALFHFLAGGDPEPSAREGEGETATQLPSQALPPPTGNGVARTRRARKWCLHALQGWRRQSSASAASAAAAERSAPAEDVESTLPQSPPAALEPNDLGLELRCHGTPDLPSGSPSEPANFHGPTRAHLDEPADKPPQERHLGLRRRAANTLITHAHERANDLRRALAALPQHASASQQEEAVRAWVVALGRPRQMERVMLLASAAATADAPADEPLQNGSPAVIATWQQVPVPPPAAQQLGRWQRRWKLLQYGARRRRRELLRELARRSEVFRRLFPHAANERRNSPRNRSEHVCKDALLVSVALIAVLVVVLAALPAAAVLLVLLPLGAIFPVVQLALSLADGSSSVPSSELLLPWTLSSLHLALLAVLLALLPVVHRFQSMRYDLVPTSGLPSAFFSLAVIREIRKRFELSVACKAMDWDYECCVCCCEITPEDAHVLKGCGHIFHGDCIAAWLRQRSTCPLCRAGATISQLTPYVSLLGGETACGLAGCTATGTAAEPAGEELLVGRGAPSLVSSTAAPAATTSPPIAAAAAAGGASADNLTVAVAASRLAANG